MLNKASVKHSLSVISLTTCLASCTAAETISSTEKGNQSINNSLDLLGNKNYPAICYSGHRKVPRSVENTPNIAETKEDLKILSAMGIRLLRTYNTTEFPHTERILKSIRELKNADPDFEMYVMMGAWIQCVNAYKDGTDHSTEDTDWNRKEIDAAIRLANEYPDIVKIIAVGNEAMVDWQAHYVPASVILKWVKAVKKARDEGRIPAGTLITTSENWAALGGEERYRNDDLAELMRQMDYVSLHTYAFHDTYYNPAMQWGPLPEENDLPTVEQIEKSIDRAIALQQGQLQAVKNYLKTLGTDKEIHIGETGWADLDNSHYGNEGTHAAYEYTAGQFYKAAMKWVKENNLTCFYFEAFDEPWKSDGPDGSEGHFGLITVDGKAKFAIWELVNNGTLKGLSRGGNPITKTHGGDKTLLLKKLQAPAHKKHGSME